VIDIQKERKQELSQLEISARVHSTSDLEFRKCRIVNGCEFAGRSETLNIRTQCLEFLQLT
jgi:hypothetical protein